MNWVNADDLIVQFGGEYWARSPEIPDFKISVKVKRDKNQNEETKQTTTS